MSNFLTTAREALVTYLQADAGLSAHVKTWYPFAATSHQPLNVAGADSPALEIGPTNQPLHWATNRSQDIEYALVARLYVKGMAVALAEEFAALFAAAVATGDATNYGVAAANGLYKTDLGAMAYERMAELPEGADLETALLRYVGWRVVAPVTLTFRRDPTVADP